MSEYNYSVFVMEREMPQFEAFAGVLKVGQRAPSFELEDLATGEPVELASLWRASVAVLEFGSFT